jgi:hypothetical protein
MNAFDMRFSSFTLNNVESGPARRRPNPGTVRNSSEDPASYQRFSSVAKDFCIGLAIGGKIPPPPP